MLNLKPHIKGRVFENYTRDVLFPEKFYTLIHETPSFNKTSKRFIASAQLPDFLFQNKKTKQYFWIECKYRKDNLNGILNINLKNFKSNKYFFISELNKLPLFYLIGFAGEPNKPEKTFLIPESKAKSKMFIEDYYKYLQQSPYIWIE